MKFICAVLALLAWGVIAHCAEKSPGQKKAEEQAENRFYAASRKAVLAPAHELLSPEAYQKYKVDLWSGNCEKASDALWPIVEKRYPKLMAARPKWFISPDRNWWNLVKDKHFENLIACEYAGSLQKAEQKLEQLGLANRPLENWRMKRKWSLKTPEWEFRHRQSDFRGLTEYAFNKKPSEIALVALARYLLNFNDKHKPAWMALQSDVPLFLLARAAIVAKKNGDPDNKPPNYDKLMTRAKKLAGAERAGATLKFAGYMNTHTYLTYIFILRSAEAGKPVREVKKLPPFFLGK